MITRRNIDISGNRFIYKRPEKLGRSLAGDERPVMDVMLSFVAYNPDVDPKSAPQTSWENVSVSGNEVICSAPVKRVLKVSSLDYCSKVKNFAITDNRISHDYRYVDFAADSDMFIFDFVVSASKVPSLEQEVRLSGNRIEAAETLPLNFWGHCAFMLEGASALLSGNEVDASHFRLQGKPTWHPASVVPVRAAYQPFSVTATGNRFVATAWPLYASEISGTGSGAVSRAVFTDNRVTGQSAMKFDRVGQVNLQVLSNEFTTSSLPLLTSGTPAGGSFNFTGNRYDYTGSAHDPELKGCDGSTGTLDRLIWRGNTVLAASAIKGITLPPAATLTDRSNRYRPTH